MYRNQECSQHDWGDVCCATQARGGDGEENDEGGPPGGNENRKMVEEAKGCGER